jgi:hypothetical protein
MSVDLYRIVRSVTDLEEKNHVDQGHVLSRKIPSKDATFNDLFVLHDLCSPTALFPANTNIRPMNHIGRKNRGQDEHLTTSSAVGAAPHAQDEITIDDRVRACHDVQQAQEVDAYQNNGGRCGGSYGGSCGTPTVVTGACDPLCLKASYREIMTTATTRLRPSLNPITDDSRKPYDDAHDTKVLLAVSLSCTNVSNVPWSDFK